MSVSVCTTTALHALPAMGRGLIRSCVAAAVIFMSIVGVAVADDAHASTKRLTNIPAQGLAPALQALAKEWNLQIVYVSEEIGERRTQGAIGEFDTEHALDRLLEGTGLTFKYLDDKTVAIVPVTSAASRSSSTGERAASQAAEAHPPSSTAQAVQPGVAITPAEMPQVAIEAQRQTLEHRLSRYVTAITAEVSSYQSLARWHDKICPRVSGLSQDQGEFVLRRISTIAQSAGAPLARRDCEANFVVLFVADPTKHLRDMLSRRASGFGAWYENPTDRAAFKQFVEDTRPIRAWYDAELRGALGNLLYGETKVKGRPPLENDHPVASRIQLDDVQNLTSVLVVVDVRRIAGLSIGAVADYAAILGLAKINPNADVEGTDSVLRLFTAPDEGKTLSQLGTWDAAFLKALYSTEQASKMQRQLIVRSMMREPTVLQGDSSHVHATDP